MTDNHIGRYELIRPIASGGMATVHLGRVVGAGGFQRVVAIKVMHPHIASDPEFVGMFLDEARLAAGIRHPNVVATLDIEQGETGLSIVMEYVEGAAANVLVKTLRNQGQRLPLTAALRIALDTLAGLHAAHELRGADGRPLGLVHRDVSPQNILVGVDGVSRITDFGVARAEARISSTRGSQVKGKVPYMSPEQLRAEPIDRKTDVYAAGVVLWELLTGTRLFRAPSDGALVAAVMAGPRQSPSDLDPAIPEPISDVTMRALAPAAERYASAAEFADALEDATESVGLHPGSARAVGRFVGQTLQAAGLLPLPETLGGAGALPADYERSPQASSAAGLGSPAHDDEAATVARDVGSSLPVAGTGSGSIVQPVATPPRRGAAVGIGAMIGGGIFLIVLAGVVTWVAVTRKNAETAAATSPQTGGVAVAPSAPPPPEPTATASSPSLPTPTTTQSAVAVDSLPSAKPSAIAPSTPPRPFKPRPVPTSKPKGSEFEPDRL